MALHKVPLKQLDVRVGTSVGFTESFGASAAEINNHMSNTGHVGYDHGADEIAVDTSSLHTVSAELQSTLEESIGKTLAIPTLESALVAVSYYRIINATNTYVNQIRNRLPVNAVDVSGNEIEVSDITSDQAGTLTVVGNTWHSRPYIQFASAPGTTVYLYFGTQRQLTDIGVADVLSSYLPSEINASMQTEILQIKGTTNWDDVVTADQSLIGLDTRVDSLYNVNHVHSYNRQFLEATTGILDTFTLPYEERAIPGSLQIQFHPGFVREGYIIAPNHYRQINNHTQVQFFAAPAAGTDIWLSYLNVMSGPLEQYHTTY